MDFIVIFGSLFVSGLIIAIVLNLVARAVPGLRWWAVGVAVAGLGAPLAVVLHNVIPGEDAISFIIAVFIAPPLLILALAGATIVLFAKREPLWMPVGLAALGAISYLVVVLTPLTASQKTTQFVIAAAITAAGALATLAMYLARRMRRLGAAT